MEKKMENEVETREYIGIIQSSGTCTSDLELLACLLAFVLARLLVLLLPH